MNQDRIEASVLAVVLVELNAWAGMSQEIYEVADQVTQRMLRRFIITVRQTSEVSEGGSVYQTPVYTNSQKLP